MVTVNSSNSIPALPNNSFGQSSADTLGVAENFEDFLALVTAQLQNQDPSSPLDPNQFAQQLVNYANVEQATSTNEKLEQLIELTKSQNTNDGVLSSASLIGKTIEAGGNIVELSGGETTFSYSLPHDAAASVITVKDQNGNEVFSSEGETEGGRHVFVWNGKGNDGSQLQDGQYIIEISGFDHQNNPVEVSTSIRGEVTAVVSGNNGVSVIVGSSEIPVTHITGVWQNDSIEPTANDNASYIESGLTSANEADLNNEHNNTRTAIF